MVQTPVQRSDNPSLESIESVIMNRWVSATWDEFVEVSNRPEFEKAKGYYFDGKMRIETCDSWVEDMGVSPNHALDNTILMFAINLFCMVHGIPLDGLTNGTYRRSDHKEVQPDISYYVGDRVELTPRGNNLMNLDESPLPDLSIEIAVSSLSDDLGVKRLLYESIGIPEYWVVDVESTEIIAFAIHDRGSTQITESRVLPGLSFEIINEALRLSRTQNQSEVSQWLMQQFQSSK
jgi:Uma2 family endonuclease